MHLPRERFYVINISDFTIMCSWLLKILNGTKWLIGFNVNYAYQSVVFNDPLCLELQSHHHYNDVMMSAMASQITSLTIAY